MSRVNFNYDAKRQGYDTNLWATLAGTPAPSGSILRFNAAEAVGYPDCFKGIYQFWLQIPAAPTAGDNRIFGLTQVGLGISAYFTIVGTVLSCITKDESGNTTTTVVPWLAGWTNALKEYSIDWSGQCVKFSIDNKQVAWHETNVPREAMSVYIKNANSDNMDLSIITGLGIETYI